MALLARLRRWKGLSRLREQVRVSPSPTTYGQLAERLIALAETEEALRVAEDGLVLFPDAPRLKQVRLYARKGRLAGHIRKLRDDLHRRPTPLTYAQLAQVYRELGSHDEALAIASECAERFPLNETSYLIQGEIRVERFRRDLIAKDAVIAQSALEKVVRLNDHNATAHLLLAELHWLTGSIGSCRRHLRSVLATLPAARDVQEFLRELDAGEDALSPKDGASFQELVEKVEQQSTFANETGRFPRLSARASSQEARAPARLDAPAVRAEMSRLAEVNGLRNAVLLDQGGAAVADATPASGLTKEQFAELVASVRDTSDDASRRMDIGTLISAEIEGPGGNVTVQRARGLTVGVLFSEPLRCDRASELVQDFVARNLTPGREEAHA